jgi:hypothetical protein
MYVEVFKDSTYIKRPLLVCVRIPAFDFFDIGFCNSALSLPFPVPFYRCLNVKVTEYEQLTHLHAGLCVQEKYQK